MTTNMTVCASVVRAQGNRKGNAVTTAQTGLFSPSPFSDAFALTMLPLSVKAIGEMFASLLASSWLIEAERMRSVSCAEWIGDAVGDDGDDGCWLISSGESADGSRMNSMTNKLTKPRRHRVKYAPA